MNSIDSLLENSDFQKTSWNNIELNKEHAPYQTEAACPPPMAYTDTGYKKNIDSIRKLYKNMPKAYLDNAAAPLILSTIPHKAADLLCSQVLVNPHSHGSLGSNTSKMIENVRLRVLNLLNADASLYDVVLCANATAGIKLVGEGLASTSHFAYKIDSHTSILGLRGLAKSYSSFNTIEDIDFSSNDRVLVSWPLQSNFDGHRYPGREWVEQVHDAGGLSLIDIASYAATEMPNFSDIQPDFAVMSFYKIFGMPDLGALIVKRSPATQEFWKSKKYFGGGTVAALTPSQPFVARPPRLTDLLEDGTLPIHSILMLQVAMDEFDSVFGGFNSIAKHTKAVANYCRLRLQEFNSITVFGHYDTPIVTFMATSPRAHGQKIGHNEFVTAAALADVHLRAGTLCNIGGFTQALGIPDSKIVENYKVLGKTCNDEISFIQGEPTGVVRASFGPYSSYEDVDALLRVINEAATNKLPLKVDVNGLYSNDKIELSSSRSQAVVKNLIVYPIKSCAGIELKQSKIYRGGLENDRLFCIVDLATKNVLSLKKNRNMIFIKPRISGSTLSMEYHSEDTSMGPPMIRSVSISVDVANWSQKQKHEDLVVCLNSEIVSFLTNILGIPCTLARHEDAGESKTKDIEKLEARDASTFANSSPLLVVATASADQLEIPDIHVFRPNIILQTKVPWIEDEWNGLTHASSSELKFIGKCRRCNMVCVTASGKSDSFPYMQLCRHRRMNGKLYFGQHATLADNMDSGDVWSVGDNVYSK